MKSDPKPIFLFTPRLSIEQKGKSKDQMEYENGKSVGPHWSYTREGNGSK